jgi:uncharacterized protein (TIGR00369 family)
MIGRTMADEASLRQLVDTVTARTGYTRSIGARIVSVAAGRVQLAVERRPELLQFNGFFHGGVISGLADHAAGGAVSTALPAGQVGVTVDLHINFLSPADGDSIVATAEAIQVGKTISVAKVEVVTEKGGKQRICAIATATLRSVNLDGPASAAPAGVSRADI